MAKYCGNCGTKWDDDIRVCGKCGVAFDGMEPYKGPNLITRKRILKAVVWMIVAAALLSGIYFGYNYYTSHTGTGNVYRKIVEAYKMNDVDRLLDLASSVYDDDTERAHDYFTYCLSNTVNSFDNELGYDYEIHYDITEPHLLSQRQLDNRLEELEYEYDDFERGDIEEIETAILTMTATHDSESERSKLRVYLSKEYGQWRLLEINKF